MTSPTVTTDWQRWIDRWEAQQGRHMPDREERFEVMVGAVAALSGDAPHVVDLGSGPGSLAGRILRRIPHARVTAIDMDPVLLTIGRHALGDQQGRLRWLDADLRAPWGEQVERPVDAAVSTTALHWLQPEALSALYRQLGTVLSPGGVFVNGDRLGFPPGSSRIGAAAAAMRFGRDGAPDEPGAETWEEWWAAVQDEPALAAELAERSRRHHDHPDHDHPLDVVSHLAALSDAGFAEADTVWQHGADRVLVAIR